MEVLFKKVVLDDKGHMAMDVNTPLGLDSDGVDSFFGFPNCGVKNVIINVTSRHGVPGFKGSHIKD